MIYFNFKPLLVLLVLVMPCARAQYKNTGYDYVTAKEDNLHGAVNEITEQYFGVGRGDTVALYTAHQRYTRDGLRLHRELAGVQVLDEYDYQYVDGRLVLVVNTYTEYKSPALLMDEYTRQSVRRTSYSHTLDGCPAMKVLNMVSGDGDTISDTLFFVCDAQCRVIEERGKSVKRYVYDEEGKMVSSAAIGANKCSYSYDAQGHVVKNELTYGVETGTFVFCYNDHGFESDITLTTDDGLHQSMHYDYTYDRHGNWVTRSDGTTMIRRTITYYNN